MTRRKECRFQNKRLNASSWDTNAGPSLMIRLPSQVPRLYGITVCVLIYFFWNLERNISLMCLMFFGLAKTYNSADTHVSPAQFLRVIWKMVFQAVTDYLFITFISTDCIHSFAMCFSQCCYIIRIFILLMFYKSMIFFRYLKAYLN